MFRFWMRLVVTLAVMLVGIQIAGYISAKKVGLVYQEPLTAKQQELKDSFLRAKVLPEVILTQDGRKLYYDTRRGMANTRKPEWLSDDGQIVLTESEKEHIAKFNLIDAKLLRVELKSIQTDNYNFLVEGVSTLYMFGLLAGLVIGLANGFRQPIERQPLVLFGAVAVVTFGSLYFFASTEKFWTTFLGTSYGLINGLLLWPLLWLIEKITEGQDSKKASTQT